jgi:hypothetical protein
MHGRDKKEEHKGEKKCRVSKGVLNEVNKTINAPHSLNQKCQKQVTSEILEDCTVL